MRRRKNFTKLRYDILFYFICLYFISSTNSQDKHLTFKDIRSYFLPTPESRWLAIAPPRNRAANQSPDQADRRTMLGNDGRRQDRASIRGHSAGIRNADILMSVMRSCVYPPVNDIGRACLSGLAGTPVGACISRDRPRQIRARPRPVSRIEFAMRSINRIRGFDVHATNRTQVA